VLLIFPRNYTSRCEFSPNKEQNDRADNRQDETRRVKRRTWLRFGKQASDQSPDDRATDAEQRGHYESEMLRTRHYGSCDQANYKPDNETKVLVKSGRFCGGFSQT